MKKIGLALGGGGAKGLAHIPMLEVIDEMGIKVHRIAGTSIGAIMGALYASGMTGAHIRELVDQAITVKGHTFRDTLKNRNALKWIQLLDLDLKHHGLLRGDKFIDSLYKAMGVLTFEKLNIPLCVVATDFWTSGQAVFESGPLLPAIRASMGLPGVFTPVTMDNRVLIDGGGVNPVPHDLLGDCDIIVAIDVMGDTGISTPEIPTMFRAMLGMFDIMQKSIISEKLKHSPPDIYIKPDITGVDILEFFKADDIYAQAVPARNKLKKELERLLS